MKQIGQMTVTDWDKHWFDDGVRDARAGRPLYADFTPGFENAEAYKRGYNSVATAKKKKKSNLDGLTNEEAGALPPGAKKYDGGKAPIGRGLINRFPRALQAIALVSEYGARKYGAYDGWEQLPDAKARYNDALGRHDLLASIEGPYDDNDSGLAHWAQRAWNALATLELALRDGTLEMRRGNDIGEDGKPILGSNLK